MRAKLPKSNNVIEVQMISRALVLAAFNRTFSHVLLGWEKTHKNVVIICF